MPKMHHLKPLSVFLVRRGGDGDRVLFRYPYSEPKAKRDDAVDADRNPYQLSGDTAVKAANHGDHEEEEEDPEQRLNERNLVSFPSKVMATLFATSTHLCRSKFELKVDDVRFVGHPMSLEATGDPVSSSAPVNNACLKKNGCDCSPGTSATTMTMFQIVFALSTAATFSVVKCYHELSHQLAIAIRYENRRCNYLECQAKLMLNAFDELSPDNPVSPFAVALNVSQLAKDLKKVFMDVSQTGVVDIRINNWSEVLFCLPQKVHKKINPNLLVEPESIFQCMDQLRPYHALLLLQNERELIEELPLDYNTAVKKVILQASPIKNFRVLAADTDLSKLFVFQIGMQLLYWGKATVIFPLCNSNLYTVSANVPNHLSPVLLDKFSEQFGGCGLGLADILQIFSLPNTLTQALPLVSRKEEYQLLARIIVWCLQHHLLVQLHTYISLALTEEGDTQLPDPLETRARRSTEPVVVVSEDNNNSSSNNRRSRHRSEQKKVIDWPPLKTVRGETKVSAPPPQQQQNTDLLSIFNEQERLSLRKVPAASNAEDLRLFVRLAPYFNGRHHLEEIMYHENVRRSVLLQLLDKFRAVIVRHEHEDTNVTMYFNASIKSRN